MPILALFILTTAATLTQAAFIPAFLPRVLQPDIFLLVGITVLAYGSKELGLTALFILGLAADLLGNGRLGLTPLSYLFAATFITRFWMRDFARGDLIAAWLGVIGATFLSQLLYIPLSALFTPKLELGPALGKSASLLVAACVWGLPAVYATGKLLFKFRIMSPPVLARWTNDQRTTDANRKVPA